MRSRMAKSRHSGSGQGLDGRRLLRMFALTIATFGLAYFAAVDAVVGIARVRNPDLALMLDAGEPRALAQVAARGLAAPETRKVANAKAYTALRHQLLTPMAFGVLASTAMSEKKFDQAERFLAASRQLSRRDELTNMLYIELSGVRGDVPAILKNYDIALRTNSDLEQQLLPRLVAAMEIPQFTQDFIKLVRTNPPWLEGALALAVDTSRSPERIAQMLSASGVLTKSPNSRLIAASMLTQLARASKWGAARSFYLGLHGAPPKMLQSIDITSASTDPLWAPLSWSFANDASVEAAVYQSESTGRPGISAIALSGERGAVARKLLFLSGGQYALEATTATFSGGAGASSELALHCLNETRWTIIGRMQLTRGTRSKILAVPANCEAQMLELEISGGDGQNGAELLVEKLDLRKVA